MSLKDQVNQSAPIEMKGFPGIQQCFSDVFLLQLGELRLGEKKVVS